MTKAKLTELIPTNGRKSFYGKAKVAIVDGVVCLRSYDSTIASMSRNGNVYRHYDGERTNTTCTHLRSFLATFAPSASEKEFWQLPVKPAPALWVDL